eukprot:12795-Heterococcus_DN1.PRE.1
MRVAHSAVAKHVEAPSQKCVQVCAVVTHHARRSGSQSLQRREPSGHHLCGLLLQLVAPDSLCAVYMWTSRTFTKQIAQRIDSEIGA